VKKYIYEPKHISESMTRITENASKAKFFNGNREKFLRYFNSPQQYDALVEGWNFKKMEEIIKANSSFDVNEFLENFNK
jgi:hypothetical protein